MSIFSFQSSQASTTVSNTGRSSVGGGYGRGSLLSSSQTGAGLRPLGPGVIPVTCSMLRNASGSISNDTIEICGKTCNMVRVCGWITELTEFSDDLLTFKFSDGTAAPIDVCMTIRTDYRPWFKEVNEPIIRGAMTSSGIRKNRIVIHATVGLGAQKEITIAPIHIRSVGISEGLIYHMSQVIKFVSGLDDCAMEDTDENINEQKKDSSDNVNTILGVASGQVPLPALVRDMDLPMDAQVSLNDIVEDDKKELMTYLYKAIQYVAINSPEKSDGTKQAPINLVCAIMKQHKDTDGLSLIRQGLKRFELYLAMNDNKDYSDDMTDELLLNLPVYFL